jgi:hypothetical protein
MILKAGGLQLVWLTALANVLMILSKGNKWGKNKVEEDLKW